MSLTVDNGLFAALFPVDCLIGRAARRTDTSMEYLGGRVVLKSNGDYLGRS